MKKIVNLMVAVLLWIATVVSSNAQVTSDGRNSDDWKDFEEKVSQLSPEERRNRALGLYHQMFRGIEFAYKEDGSVPAEVADGLFFLFVSMTGVSNRPVFYPTQSLLEFCMGYCFNRRTATCGEDSSSYSCTEAAAYCSLPRLQFTPSAMTRAQLTGALARRAAGLNLLLSDVR